MNEEAFEFAKVSFTSAGRTMKEAEFHREAFGSWYIVIEAESNCRLVYDGKENRLLVERRTNELFNDMPVWSEIWISHKPSKDDLSKGITKLLETTE